MTGPEIGDAAVEAFIRRAATGPDRTDSMVAFREHVRACLAAALPHLEAAARADERAKTAREIHDAIQSAFAAAGPERGTKVPDPTARVSLWAQRFAYDHAAALAWQLRVPDCGDQWHGADGGPCGGCGFDPAVTPQDPASGPSGRAEHQPAPVRRPTAGTGPRNAPSRLNPAPAGDGSDGTAPTTPLSPS